MNSVNLRRCDELRTIAVLAIFMSETGTVSGVDRVGIAGRRAEWQAIGHSTHRIHIL